MSGYTPTLVRQIEKVLRDVETEGCKGPKSVVEAARRSFKDDHIREEVLAETRMRKLPSSKFAQAEVITQILVDLCHEGKVKGYTRSYNADEPYFVALQKWKRQYGSGENESKTRCVVL